MAWRDLGNKIRALCLFNNWKVWVTLLGPCRLNDALLKVYWQDPAESELLFSLKVSRAYETSSLYCPIEFGPLIFLSQIFP